MAESIQNIFFRGVFMLCIEKIIEINKKAIDREKEGLLKPYEDKGIELLQSYNGVLP